MSVIDEELEPTSLGSQVVGHLVDLPIGEGSPVVRLHQVSYALRVHSETGRAVAADRIAGVAGFAPTTFHALGSRVAFKEARGNVNLVVTNVPGPQFPMYLAGAEMVETYPVPPLLAGFSLVGRRHVVRRGGLLRHQRRPRRAAGHRRARPVRARVARRARRQRQRQPAARAARPQAHSADARAGRMSVRIYVPATLTALAGFVADGGVGPAPVRARAVTAWLREASPEADEEEWEYAALMAAADDSAGLLTAEDRPRRVVLVADVDSAVESDDSTLVEVAPAFPFRLVKAVHADTDDVERAASYDPEALGDLAWFGVQEIPDLLP